MAINYPEVNGSRPDWSRIKIKLGAPINKEIIGFTSIDYKDPLKPTKLYGTNSEPIGRTRGQVEPDGSLEGYLDEIDELITTLGNGYKEIPFDVEVSYTKVDSAIKVDQLIGCRIIDIESSHSQGPDGLKNKLPLDIMKIIRSGLESTLNPLKGPPTS